MPPEPISEVPVIGPARVAVAEVRAGRRVVESDPRLVDLLGRLRWPDNDRLLKGPGSIDGSADEELPRHVAFRHRLPFHEPGVVLGVVGDARIHGPGGVARTVVPGSIPSVQEFPASRETDHPMFDEPHVYARPTWNVATTVEPSVAVSGSASVL